MTPRARDLQEPGQHDMIEELRDALRQNDSQELNPRMHEALTGFREHLKSHPYVIRLQRRAAKARTAQSRFLTRARVAGLAAIVGVAIAVVLLITARPPSIFAAVLDAMAEVETAHIVTTEGDADFEAWFSREHGVRNETANYIEILTPEAGWVYDRRAGKVTVRGALPDAVNECFMSLSGTYWLTRDDVRRIQVSDVVLRGAPAKRIDMELPPFRQHSPPSSTVWIDPATMRVMSIEMRDSDHEGHIIVNRYRIEYDMPVDPALFTFEPPEGTTIADCPIGPELDEVIAHALDAVKTLPMRETGVEFYFNGSRRDFDHWVSWEAWRQNEVGYRQEYTHGLVDGTVEGGNVRDEWRLSGSCPTSHTHAEIEDQRSPYFMGQCHTILENLRRGEAGRVGRWPLETLEVTREENNGRELARFVGFFVTSGNTSQVSEQCKEVTTFDVDAQRLIEYELYVWNENQWRLAEHLQWDYPDELPSGIFDFNPPPGAHIEDRRGD